MVLKSQMEPPNQAVTSLNRQAKKKPNPITKLKMVYVYPSLHAMCPATTNVMIFQPLIRIKYHYETNLTNCFHCLLSYPKSLYVVSPQVHYKRQE